MNINQWIRYVAKQLRAAGLHYGHGTDNPEDEAAWLVLHAAGAVPGDGQQLDRQQESRLREYLAARTESGLPLAYILGSAWFAGLEFEVDRSVLVPRSPIAELILEGFTPWLKGQAGESVLDLCTGSGCIGIATAVHMPQVQVDAADISEAALGIARRNVARHGVAARVQLALSDLFSALAGRRYDLIVTNPPYVPVAALPELPAEYRAEPELGLLSGSDGLDACLQIMVQSPAYLKEQGTLICEVGESERRLAEALPTVPFWWLEFGSGGSGVFVLSRQQLMDSSAAVAKVIEDRKDVR
jgi:ribosomal protein L3 glutamine methyltransferase